MYKNQEVKEMMNRLWKRFTLLDKNTRINLLIYPFLIATLSYGVGFVVFGTLSAISVSSLYAAMYSLHSFIPYVWGIGAIISVVLALIVVGKRKWVTVGDTAALLGSMTWIFALMVYAVTGGWLLVFAVAGPNLLFWVWFFFRLSNFRKFGIPDPVDKK